MTVLSVVVWLALAWGWTNAVPATLAVEEEAALLAHYPPASSVLATVPSTPEMSLYVAQLDSTDVPPSHLYSDAPSTRSNTFNTMARLDRKAWANPSDSRTLANALAKYAGAVYCRLDSNIKNWKCGAHCGKGTENTRVIDVFYASSTGGRGFVAVNDRMKAIVVSIRGSLELKNFIQDLRMWKTPLNITGCPSDAEVHTGFLDTWLSVAPVVKKLVAKQLDLNPSYTLYVTGHSLGGATSVIGILDLRASLNIPDKRLVLYTFGSPRVGNIAFAEWLAGLKFSIYRLIHENDLVAQLPPRFLGYRHHTVEYYDYNGSMYVCDDSSPNEDLMCSSARYPWLNIASHMKLLDTTFGPWC